MPPDTKQLILGSKTPKPNVTPDRKKVALREVNYRLDENTGPIRDQDRRVTSSTFIALIRNHCTLQKAIPKHDPQ
jgi:hypothetical protein